MTFIAGRYTATLGGVSLGQMAEGLKLSHQFFKRLITGDAFGEGPQDAVYRGVAVLIGYTLIEFDAAAAKAAMWPYHATFLNAGIIGRCDVASGIVSQLVLTAIAGTTAAAAPATITLPKAIIQEGFPVDLLFAPDLREIPIRQRIYPDSSGVFGTQT